MSTHPRSSVCAVLAPGRVEDAVTVQEHKPEMMLSHHDFLSAGLARAAGSPTEWIWLLDGSAIPRPDALGLLVAAIDRLEGLPEAVLLTGLTVDALGRADEARAPWYRRAPTETAMDAAQRGLLPVRAASGSVLIRRRALEAHRPRRRLGAEAGVFEWTARILRQSSGYWVPQSESVRSYGIRSTAPRLRLAAHLAAGGAFAGLDRGRALLELLEHRPVKERR